MGALSWGWGSLHIGGTQSAADAFTCFKMLTRPTAQADCFSQSQVSPVAAPCSFKGNDSASMGPPQSYTGGKQMCLSRPLPSLRSGGRHWRAACLYPELSFLPTDIPHHPRDSPVSTDRLQNRTPSKGKGGILTVTAAPVGAGPAPTGWIVMSNLPEDVLRCQPL